MLCSHKSCGPLFSFSKFYSYRSSFSVFLVMFTALVRSTRRRFDVEMTPEEHHQMNHAAAAAAAAAGMQPPGIPAGGLPPPTSSSSSSANPPHPSQLGHSGRHGNVFFPRPTHPLAGGPPPPPSSGPSQPPISSSGSNLAQPIPQRAASNNSPLNIQPPKPSVLNGGSNASSSMADKVWNFNAEFAKFGGPIVSIIKFHSDNTLCRVSEKKLYFARQPLSR